MTTLPHEIIRASAGSGKTYQLTLRFIRLLALGAAPDHIVALTFTRKAAGEFFARILTRLAEASSSEAQARALSQAVGVDLGIAECRRLLREMVSGMHRLRLGTLDGFFAQILRSFPYEFGLGGDFQVSSAEMAVLDRQRVLARLFEPGEELSAAQREFFEAFKQATWGHEDYRLGELLDRFIIGRHGWLLAAPFRQQWGGAELIWGQDGAPPPLTPEQISAATESVRSALSGVKMTDKQLARWDDWLGALPGCRTGDAFEKPFSYFSERLGQWRVLPESDVVEIAVDRKNIPFPLPAWRRFLALVAHPLALEIEAACLRTQGVWAMLAQYEAAYHRLVRREGRLAFADVQALLAGATPAQRLASDEPPLESLSLGWRLDGRFDHWLLDEFQDTSLLQWRIIRPLVDEVLQDTSGQRTYFHVGDAKQAIYAWREGEARLTDQIIEHYGEGLQLTSLSQSFRSAPVVLEAVNRVCGALPLLDALFGEKAPGAVARWEAIWEDHTCGKNLESAKGHAALVRPPVAEPEPGEAKAAAVFRAELAAVAALLRRINPLRRGLSCAILTPKNAQARTAAVFLQKETGMTAVSDAKQHPAQDNAPCRAVLALLQWAAHPGDTMASEAVLMTPLRGVLAALGWPAAEIPARVRRQFFDGGMAGCVAFWAGRLRQARPRLDAFNLSRLAELEELAARFDDENGADLDDFILCARSAEARGTEASDAIQCMTVHGSKGLEFDVVFLAGLDGDSFTTVDAEWLRQRQEDLEPAWYLRGGKKEVAEGDPVLAQALAGMIEEEVYESFCTTYVAMTRAKRALYLIAAPPGADSKTGATTKRNAAVWIDSALADGAACPPLGDEKDALEVAWENGDRAWFTGMEAKAKAPQPAEPLPSFPAPAEAGARRHLATTPSGSETWRLRAEELFSPGRQAGLRRGVLVHALWEQIADPDHRTDCRQWFARHYPQPSDAEKAALAEVEACLDDPAIAQALTVPPWAKLWRERRFEIILDGQWVTGTIDRAHISLDEAVIIDFKTDLVADEAAAREKAASYQPQLDLYRRVLARLTGLPESRIRWTLVFTRPRLLVRDETTRS